MTRGEIKSIEGSEQESPLPQTAVLARALEEMKDFGWINLSTNVCIFQLIVIPSAFGAKHHCVSEWDGCDYRRGNDATLRFLPIRHGNGPLRRSAGKLWASAGKPEGCGGGLCSWRVRKDCSTIAKKAKTCRGLGLGSQQQLWKWQITADKWRSLRTHLRGSSELKMDKN